MTTKNLPHRFPIVPGGCEDAVLIRSSDRDAGYNNTEEFVITLQQTQGLFGRYIVAHAQVPNSVYNVRTGVNDEFWWNEQGGNLDTTIPEGAYTGDTLAAALKTAMDAKSAYVYTVTYDDTTGKLSFSYTGTGSITFLFGDNAGASTSAYKVMGFNEANAVTPPNVINLASPPSLAINCREAYHSAGFKSSTGASFHLLVPLLSNFGTYNFQSSDTLAQYLEFNQRVRRIQLTIRDPGTGQLLPLNGSDWELFLIKVA